MSDRAAPVGVPFWGDADDGQALHRYRTLVDGVDDGIYQLDAEGRFVGANEKIVAATGYAREELLGEHVSTVLDDADVERMERDVRKRLESGDATGSVTYETAIETADGVTLTCELRVSLLVEGGEFRGSIGIVRDVTERKRRERHIEAELAEVVERITDGFFALDTDWTITHINEQATELLGAGDRDLVGANLWEEFPDVVDTSFERAYRRAMESQEPVTVEAYYPPLSVWFEDHIYPSETGLSVYFQDITDRKERERALEESERRYRTLVENFPNGAVGLYDERFAYTVAGGEFLDELGISAAEIVGNTIYERYPDDLVERIKPHFAAVFEGESNSFEVEYHDRNLLAHTLPVRDAADEIFAGMLMVQDVTERTEYRRELEASNERLEQFAYAASHDLQEPLRMVSSYLRLLESRYADELDADGREFIDFAVDGADRMREMIEGLLEYSRIETRGDPMEPVALDDVLDDTLETLQVRIAEHDAEIAADPLPRVRGDESQLRQLFQNLLDNAIEYSADGPPRVRVSAERGGRRWEISVRDEGIGIEPDQQDRIFEVFQRLHSHEDHAGAGIGLALCERIVERHGGELTVDSAPDEGSTFSFTLPAADA